MKTISDCFELNNGVKIPCIGFGTWRMNGGDEGISIVKEALFAGYRHIDTAAAYENEESVGLGIKESGIPREEIFITSKLRNTEHGYDKTMKAFEITLNDLSVDYLDLYLIHWPNPVMFRDNWQEANAGSWKAFEELYNAGKIRSIGISNFHERHIKQLMETATIAPMVNQIRLCPGDTQDAIVNYCSKNNILLEAYSPFGAGAAFDVPALQDLAKKYNVTVAQLCVRWSLQKGFLPLPKASKPERMINNADVFGFELSEGDVRAISEMKGCCGYSKDPDSITF